MWLGNPSSQQWVQNAKHWTTTEFPKCHFYNWFYKHQLYLIIRAACFVFGLSCYCLLYSIYQTHLHIWFYSILTTHARRQAPLLVPSQLRKLLTSSILSLTGKWQSQDLNPNLTEKTDLPFLFLSFFSSLLLNFYYRKHQIYTKIATQYQEPTPTPHIGFSQFLE